MSVRLHLPNLGTGLDDDRTKTRGHSLKSLVELEF